MKYFIIAGEASGDLHGANLMRALKEQDTDADFCFLGGDLMSQQSSNRMIHIREMAFMGIVNVVLNLSKIHHNMRVCHDALLRYQPDCVILIDYPGFNLKIAKFVKENLSCPVYYYISPKLWAWKSYRIHSMKRYIDRTFTIFPFETSFFAKYNYKVDYVGNPTVDSVATFKQQHPFDTSFREKYGLDERPIIALLAGSRKQEIKGCLPTMMKMVGRFPAYQFVVAGAPGIEREYYNQFHVEHIVFDNTYELVRQAKVAVVNSGTATLETALLETPQIVVYHVFAGRIASVLKKILIKIPYVSLTNLVAGREVVPELLAHHFTDHNLEHELNSLLTDDTLFESQKKDYRSIISTLGNAGTAERAAHKIYDILLEKE